MTGMVRTTPYVPNNIFPREEKEIRETVTAALKDLEPIKSGSEYYECVARLAVIIRDTHRAIEKDPRQMGEVKFLLDNDSDGQRLLNLIGPEAKRCAAEALKRESDLRRDFEARVPKKKNALSQHKNPAPVTSQLGGGCSDDDIWNRMISAQIPPPGSLFNSASP